MSRFTAFLRGLVPPKPAQITRDGHVVSLVHAYYGPLRVLAEDTAISQHMCDAVSVWEADIVKLFAREFQPGRNVIDAGANLGLHTIALAKLATRGERIYAFEPHPEILPLTRFNCGEHPNVECIGKAASDEVGILYMPSIVAARNAGSGQVFADQAGLPYAVEAVTIDSLCLSNIGLMKVDVEGHEMSCIRGARETIRRDRPTLIVEICGGSSLDTAAPAMAAMIRSRIAEICDLGYSMTQVSTHDYLFHAAG